MAGIQLLNQFCNRKPARTELAESIGAGMAAYKFSILQLWLRSNTRPDNRLNWFRDADQRKLIRLGPNSLIVV
jgi:hypothetical protein